MFGEKIRQLRKLKERTQKELADHLGYSEAQISHIENGNRKVGNEDLQKIADFFNISSDYFFPKNNNFVNFRYDGTGGSDVSQNLISDFKKFAIKKLYGEENKR